MVRLANVLNWRFARQPRTQQHLCKNNCLGVQGCGVSGCGVWTWKLFKPLTHISFRCEVPTPSVVEGQPNHYFQTQHPQTVGFHNFNLRIFNLRVSNPNKLIVDVFLTRCRISMCQGLGPNEHDEISEIDRTTSPNSRTAARGTPPAVCLPKLLLLLLLLVVLLLRVCIIIIIIVNIIIILLLPPPPPPLLLIITTVIIQLIIIQQW